MTSTSLSVLAIVSLTVAPATWVVLYPQEQTSIFLLSSFLGTSIEPHFGQNILKAFNELYINLTFLNKNAIKDVQHVYKPYLYITKQGNPQDSVAHNLLFTYFSLIQEG